MSGEICLRVLILRFGGFARLVKLVIDIACENEYSHAPILGVRNCTGTTYEANIAASNPA